MKNGVNNYLHKAYVVCVILLSVACVGCGNDQKGHDQSEMNKRITTTDESIVRTGAIDLQMIDLNKDGKVYQDPMDWNVISDVAGKCPLCKMELQEVTLQEAKDNLIENDFEVKNN